MTRFIFILILLSTLTFPAISCELPKGEVIKIGCTDKCDFFYRFRIFMVSWGMGYTSSVTQLNPNTDIKEALRELDAVLIPGGADIDPKFYLDDVTPELASYTRERLNLVKFTSEGRRRDPYEYQLVKLYSEDNEFKELPLLGICRGLQMMSVAQGIPLYLDIKTELGIKNRMHRFDRIQLNDEVSSLMSSLYQSNRFKGFKLHHQGIRVPYFLENQNQYPNTKVTAYSNDGKIAEAIEYTHRPALGVQYHPERSFPKTSLPVFNWFLRKACEYKTSRKEKR